MAQRTATGTRARRTGATIEDVAAAAGVSNATVSRAIRGLPRVAQPTRTRILEIAKTLGYTPSASATGLATGRTRSIGVVTSSLRHPAYSAALEGAEKALHQREYSLILLHHPHLPTSPQPHTNLNMLRRRVDALLILGARTLGQNQIEQFIRDGIPCIVIRMHNEQDDGIQIQAAVTAICHLVQLGHADLVLFQDGATTGFQLRLKARGLEHCANALNAAGIRPREIRVETRSAAIRNSRKAFSRLWAETGPKPTAIVCASDEIALGVLLEAGHIGITIPKDLSIVGMDGQNLSEALGLTSVSHQPARRANAGIHRLLDALEGDHGITYAGESSPELVIRQSTAPRKQERA